MVGANGKDCDSLPPWQAEQEVKGKEDRRTPIKEGKALYNPTSSWLELKYVGTRMNLHKYFALGTIVTVDCLYFDVPLQVDIIILGMNASPDKASAHRRYVYSRTYGKYNAD